MKITAIIAVLFLSLFSLKAQQLNDQGFYVSSDGELFTGRIVSSTNGVKSQLQIKQGIVSGEAVYYFASGAVMEKGFFTAGKKDQQWTRFDESGKVTAVAFYNLGKKSGTWTVFDDKGIKRFEMNYTDGEKSGKWTSWDENGVMLDVKDYSIAN